MKREDIKKIFPDATEEQLKGLLDINTADIGKAKGELEAVKADLEKANGTLKEYETTIADMKKSAEGNEDFKKKFEELEQRIADEKAEAEKKAKAEAEEAEYSNRFKTVVGEQKWRDALTEKAVYAEFKTALQDEANKGKGDKDILAALTQDKEYFAKDPARVPAFSRGTGFAGGEVDDAAVRAAMGLSPKKD
jgi:Rad3-related DNA helicase|uniref:Minor structural protein n=1 Tax=Siphoviridae sp. cti0B23 TaxID=2825619 RepID=A0A8S5UDV4_9CAUD|nr:MAG TPA: minor structural protein [Siphoviridae sp. cti0B23]